MVDQSVRRRITSTLFITQGLFGAAQIAAFTVIPIVAAQLGGSERLAGVPMTVAFLSRALSAYPFGWIMDHLGRRTGLTLGYLTALVSSVLCMMAIDWTSFLWFCAGVALSGVGRSSGEQARYVAAEAHPPADRAKIIGLIVFAGTISAIGGPLLVAPSGAWVARYEYDAFAGPFAVGVVLSGVALALTQIFLRPDPLTLATAYASETPISISEQAVRSIREIASDPRVRLGVAAMVIGQFVMTLLMVITPLHMNHHHHGTETISLVIMAHTLGMFGLSSLTGRLVSRYGQLAVVRAGILILVASCVISPISPQFIPLALALFLLGLGWNFCFIAGSSMLASALAPHERGRIQGGSEMFIALAASSASLLTGVLFEAGGMTLLGGLGLLSSIALGAYSARFFRRVTAMS